MKVQRSLWVVLLTASCGSGRDVPPGSPGMQNPGRDGGTTNGSGCPAMFEGPQACGGDPIGDWRYTRFCSDLITAQARMTCPQGTYTLSNVMVNGTLSMTATQYSQDVTWAYTVDAVFPVQCIMQIGDCEAYERLIIQSGSVADCTQNADNCDCMLQVSNREASVGLLMVGGSTLTFTSTRGMDNSLFCRNGNRMILGDSPEVFILER